MTWRWQWVRPRHRHGAGGYCKRRLPLETAWRYGVFHDPTDGLDPLDVLIRQEREAEIDALVASVRDALSAVLPPQQRETVRLLYFECLGEAATARALGVTRARVYNSARDGVRRLKRHFDGTPLRDWHRGARRAGISGGTGHGV